MIKIAVAVLLLALTGCVAPMPSHDENNRILNQYHAPDQWMPRMLFE
ncbi:hypothetical protein [Dongia sedimenti]|uniref:Lipoprotein n=1 Tax=Dongia sedimenti TaxID=3064282 RepID=A0ABU0YMW3_9PROT|nr:hypothetical protein [Rhodospirillaceae bacterium R-7]